MFNPIGKKINVVKRKTVNFVKGFDRRFYELFLEHLSKGNQEIHEALDIITRMDREMHSRFKYGYGLWFISHKGFLNAWKVLIENNKLINDASARIHMINNVVRDIGARKFMKLIRGNDLVDPAILQSIIHKVEKEELEYIDQIAHILDEICQDFLTYSKYVNSLLDAYTDFCRSDELKKTAVITREEWDYKFNKGISELNNAAKLLRKGKKLVFKKLRKAEIELRE